VCERAEGPGIGSVTLTRRRMPDMPPELAELFEHSELANYLTDDELQRVKGGA
jgi:hypothetical protein